MTDGNAPATASDIRDAIATAVQIATINTTLTDHERRIAATEKFNNTVMFWIVGTFATSFTAVVTTVLSLVLKITGVLR